MKLFAKAALVATVQVVAVSVPFGAGSGGVALAATTPVTVSANPATITVCSPQDVSSITANASTKNGTSATFLTTANNPSGYDSGLVTIGPVNGKGTSTETTTATATGTKIGSTTLTFTDSTASSGSVTVTVSDPLTASPGTLSFSGQQQSSTTFTVSNSCSGTIASMSYDSSAMTVSGCPSGTPLSSAGVSCTVKPLNATTNSPITIQDSFGGTATVSVTISSGPLVLSPASGSSLNAFVESGPASAFTGSQTFTAQETSYTGSFTTSVTTSAGTTPVVNVSPTSALGPGPKTFTVTPANYGKGTVQVAAGGNTGTLNVLVSGGTISMSNSAISYNNVTDNTTQYLASSNVNVTGSLMTVSSGTQIAVLSPSLSNSAIPGTHGGQLPLAALTYSCSGTSNSNKNQGASFAVDGSGGVQHLALVSGLLSQPCVQFNPDTYSNLAFMFTVYLDDRDIPADNYSANGFLLVLSAN